MTTATCWMLFSLCYCYGIHPATCLPKWMMPQFPCDVKASNTSDIIFDCRSQRLHKVPEGITSNATELDLSGNSISNITMDAFSHLENLIVLRLNDCGLQNISVGAFKCLKKLQVLELSGNDLKDVPRYVPPSLRNLTLDENNITLLDNESLNGLRNVTMLSIAKNCYAGKPCGKPLNITNTNFSDLSNLKLLNLSYNNLTCVPKDLPESIEELYLNSNRIEFISVVDFHNLPQMRTLFLQGNCPRCETASYPCVPCPNISLGIHPSAFANLKNLHTLHLGGNSLMTLNDTWFKSLNNLKCLYLSWNFLNNAIVGEMSFFKDLPKLEKLDLSFNYGIKAYPKRVKLSKDFSKLESLRTLHLEGLVFMEIGSETLSPLCDLKNLSALNLGTNFIVYSNSTIFSNFTNLKMIYLAENRLYPITLNNLPVVDQGYNLKSDLSVSPLVATPHVNYFSYEISTFLIQPECFDAGRVLILSKNNIFFITQEQFKGYGDIACLNLSNNAFSAALNGTEFSSLPNLTYLDLSYNRIDLAYDNALKELNKLEVLDLSFNEHYFLSFGITHNLNFLMNLPALRVLNMSHNSIYTLATKTMSSKSLSELQFQYNNLGALWKIQNGHEYYRLFSNLTNLTILDISSNYIHEIEKEVFANLPHTLTILRVNHNLLTGFEWDQLKHFTELKILDLSFNELSNVPSHMSNFTQTLSILDLSNNHISQLSNGFLKGIRSLESLLLNNNQLTIINQSTFYNLDNHDNNLKTLFLQENPFQCTCDILDFIIWIENSKIKIPRLTTEVKCGMPINTKGQAIIDFDIHQCVNDTLAFSLSILSSTIIIVSMFMATLAHLFYWDASYVLHYLKAKFKGYHAFNSPGSIYDVFVAYDTTDPQVSEWVTEHLRVQLEEEGERHLPLCLEERDWPPGVPLVDNLTQSIQYSRKTLFVLTKAYIRTGAFKLAMYLAHQRLLDENMDVIVLVMMEPVLQHSHFLRLRMRLCGKSVLECPRTMAAEPWFWQNLRNVVRADNQRLYNKSYIKYFKDN